MTDAASETIGAREIARRLGLRDEPTDQQCAVIESPLEPALVVAGAGSGKTETMASRVLWLLANGHVRPGEVLGLTFTRKAAGELAERIRRRVVDLDRAGLLPGGYDPFDPPQVSTYNAFANTLYRDHALLLGRESDGAVLGEGAAWQLARTVVLESDDDRLAGLGQSADTLADAVLRLAHGLSENVADPDAVEAMAHDVARLDDLPAGGQGRYESTLREFDPVRALPVLLGLARRYSAQKRRRGLVEYADQVALGLEIVRSAPRVGEELRSRHRVLLLDEYQDTSVVQALLLAEVFAGRPVMAVGDPNQAIYGWRGASSANLEQFGSRFGAGAVPQYALSTSWRNDEALLEAANLLSAPLSAASAVPVERLAPGPAAGAGRLDLAYPETLEDEAEAAAEWLAERLAEAPEGHPPSLAMLFRKKATRPVFVDALRRHGVPYHVLGYGGLLDEPEIADLVSALRVVSDPGAGAELVRLLAGARWRVGVRDLRALAGLARWLAERDHAQRRLDPEVHRRLRESVVAEEGGSIVDALDVLPRLRDGHPMLRDFSAEGLTRLRDAGAFFARLRSRGGLGLLESVTLVEQELLLDVEAVANETRPLGERTTEAFHEAVAAYLAVSERPGLPGFLGWLAAAEKREDLTPRPEDPEPGTVQLLTVHAAKGLEWDFVAIPRFVEGEFPAAPKSTRGWLTLGELPYEFRGDRADLPVLRWRSVASRKELLDACKAYKAEVKQRHGAEERRLAYVAVTRARHAVLLSGSHWSEQESPRPPGTFGRELLATDLVGPDPAESRHESNPRDRRGGSFSWPFDPLGGRRGAVERAAALVADVGPGSEGVWHDEVERLLEERRLALERDERVPLPARIPASGFKDYVTDPAAVASARRRPMPERPYRATRLGTLFHAWVEERYGVGAREEIDAFADELDADPDERGRAPLDEADRARLAELKRTFERSRWALLRPVEVEREIHLPFEGRTVVCKLDAVFHEGGRYRVVDWKTGRAPRDEEDLRRRQLQLALYRQAYAHWSGVPEELIDACFYFVADDREIEPDALDDAAALSARWREALRDGS